MSPSSFQVVGVPTWLWLDRTQWVPQTATVSVPGVVVTATATPVQVTWDPGDGNRLVACNGPGTPFTDRSDPDTASPDCGYIYRRPSKSQPDGQFTVQATIHWRVDRRAQGTGQQGVFPELVTTSTRQVEAREVQTLVVHGSSGD